MPPPPRASLASRVGALVLFAVLAALHTWPLIFAPATLSRHDNGDYVLHAWIMAWVAHQTITDPRHLFDANIFFPERDTLAYSDHLFAQSMLGAPLSWAGASPVLVHNVVLIAGLALTGWTAALVVRRWTGRWLPGILSGCLLAFNAFTLTRLPQIQDLHLEFFPLTLFALDRLFCVPRVRHALLLALWFVLQCLTGTYLMVFTTISVIAAALSRSREWAGAQRRQLLPLIGLASLVSIACIVPFILPYYAASETVGLGRSLEETQRYSAELSDYLVAPGTIYFEWMGWGRTYWQGDALFPGVVALALALFAIVRYRWNDRRVRMIAVIGLTAFALSFGPAFPPYRVLYCAFPLLQGIRGAVRFGEIALAAIALLAGFGLAALIERLPSRAVIVALIVGANAEALRAPMYYLPYRGTPAVFEALDELSSKSVLAFFPFYNSAQFHQNAAFMLMTTKHFHRMVNGYSGFKPASFYQHVERLAAFPDATSVQYLQQLGVTVALVDGRHMRPDNLARLDQFPQLTLWKSDDNFRIYLVRRE